MPAGASVAVCGAGNCDDLPLRRLAAHAGRLDLLDLDPAVLPRRRAPACRACDRGRVRVLEVDASEGLADRIVAAAARGEPVLPPPAADLQRVAAAPLGEPPYDVVVGDLLYSQLLFPGLRDLELGGERIDAVLRAAGQPLTDGRRAPPRRRRAGRPHASTSTTRSRGGAATTSRSRSTTCWPRPTAASTRRSR